jgi:hypothetical protein
MVVERSNSRSRVVVTGGTIRKYDITEEIAGAEVLEIGAA